MTEQFKTDKQNLLVLAEPQLPEKSFWADESGAISTDEVVLMGAIIGIALLAIGNFSDGAQFLATDRQQTLSGYRGITSSATNDGTIDVGGGGGDEDDGDDGGRR